MRKAFMCSLCYNGIVGGGLYLDNQAVTFRTQKLTVSEKFKNLRLYRIIIFKNIVRIKNRQLPIYRAVLKDKSPAILVRGFSNKQIF